jgi:regulatory protein
MPRKANDPPITRLEPLRPRGLRVRVHLDRGAPLDVALEALERTGLGIGDLLTPNRRQHLEETDRDVQVREAALGLLSHQARTRAELGRRLRAKGFRPARVTACLDRLEARGLLDDSAVASAFVRDRLRLRPRGRTRLAAELRSKGVSADLADRVVNAVLDEEGATESQLATRVAQAWLKRQGASVVSALTSGERTPGALRARRRLHGYLARRGFGGAALVHAMDAALEAESDRETPPRGR